MKPPLKTRLENARIAYRVERDWGRGRFQAAKLALAWIANGRYMP